MIGESNAMTRTNDATPEPKARRTGASQPAPRRPRPMARRTGKPVTAAPGGGPFPVVGIGASAGGLAAIEAFFSGMPADLDPGMAFVLVQHLDPDHKSMLSELIRRYTRMPVFEVEDGMRVQPNCAYIIPPNRDMALLDGSLQLMAPTAPRGQRLPIDYFFRSLAQDQRELAIGIVLSGTGSDGTQGVRAIKGEGGMVMVQSPETTEYDGMPCSALATGLVDYQLPPAQMPAELMAYAAHAVGHRAASSSLASVRTDNALKKIIHLLRVKTGHDFSQYKPSTIQRRIERRLAVHRIDSVDGYVAFLQQASTELEALFRDLLIGVTNFFRDPEAFRALEEKVIPGLFAGDAAGAGIRIWSAGCSTGEEAYSIAILLQERMEALKENHKVQIFATDIDSQAVATARIGLYPASIAADLTPERLRRFFSAEPGGGYRIQKAIRDMLVFSEQDLVKDPPFSRLDLICCRNLLIYMGGELQKRLIPLFHYALNPGGFLFQGSSETLGECAELFIALDRKWKLYRKREDLQSAQRAAMKHMLPLLPAHPGTARPHLDRTGAPVKVPLREMTEQALLHQVIPAGVLVNEQGDIFYLHGRTGMYLEPTPGEAGISNVLKMAREGLRGPLTTALHQAARSAEIVRSPGVRVKTNGDFTRVDLLVRPLFLAAAAQVETPLFLVILEPSPEPALDTQEASAGNGEPAPEPDSRVAALSEALRAKEDFLRASNEELETANEELKSSNEEMQSVNEELQSTNEELETSKEELQSVNEELATVNAELQAKVSDLSHAYNDMNNLLAGTGIATVFVDLQLRILRFTPSATQVINLIPGDVGRPVGHILTNLLEYDRLVADVRGVLDSLTPVELEVQTRQGAWYTLRIQLYRTLDNVIEGAVITFVDISDRKQAEATARVHASLFWQLAECLPQLVWTCSPDGAFDYFNPRWGEFTGVTQPEALGFRWLRQVHPEDRDRVLEAWGKAVTAGASGASSFRLRHHSGEYRWFESRVGTLRDASGRIVKSFSINTESPGGGSAADTRGTEGGGGA
jgi:two-component system CheB/CheR fusion protein